MLGDDGKPSDDTIVNEVESHHKLLFAGGLLVCIFWVGNSNIQHNMFFMFSILHIVSSAGYVVLVSLWD